MSCVTSKSETTATSPSKWIHRYGYTHTHKEREREKSCFKFKTIDQMSMPVQFCCCKIVGGSKVWLWCVAEGFGSGVCHARDLCWAKQVHLSFPSSLKAYPEHVDRGPLVSKDGIPWLFQLCTGVMTCPEDHSLQPWHSLQWIQCHPFHGFSLTMGCWCGGFFCLFSCVISLVCHPKPQQTHSNWKPYL